MDPIHVLTILALTSTVISEYAHRESAGVLFTENTRTIRKYSGLHRLTFALKIPQFHRITRLAKTIKDAHYCHTFHFMEHECNYTLASFHSEHNHLFALIRQYNSEIELLNGDLSALTIQTSTKRALLDISGFLGSLFGTASQSQIKDLEGKLFSTVMYAKHPHDASHILRNRGGTEIDDQSKVE